VPPPPAFITLLYKAAPKKFRDGKAPSGRVLAIAMPTCQLERFPYYSPVQPSLTAETSPGKSKKMGISRNLNRRHTRRTLLNQSRLPCILVFQCVAFTLICGY
jgi:hypothetical protein